MAIRDIFSCIDTPCGHCRHLGGEHSSKAPHACTECRCAGFEKKRGKPHRAASPKEPAADTPPQLPLPEEDELEAVADWRRAIVRAWDEESPRAAMRVIGPAGHRLAAALIAATRQLKQMTSSEPA